MTWDQGMSKAGDVRGKTINHDHRTSLVDTNADPHRKEASVLVKEQPQVSTALSEEFRRNDHNFCP